MSYHSGQDPKENLPDWLKDLRKRQSTEGPESLKPGAEEAKQNPEEEGEPDWLKEIRQRYGHTDALEKGPAIQESEPALSDTQPIPSQRSVEPVSEREEKDANQKAFIEEPDSLEELEGKFAKEPQGTGAETPKREFPDWLHELGELDRENKREGEGPDHIPAFTEGGEELTPGELPGWLEAIRPSGIIPETRSPEKGEASGGEIPTKEGVAGPLAGLSGVLPAEPGAIQSIKPPIYTARLDLTDNQNQHVAAFKKILEEEGKSREDLTGTAEKPVRFLNLLMGAALLLAVLIPLFTQSQSTPRPQLEVFPEASEVFNRIDILPAGAPVLVAFDLQPALFGETRPAATAVLDHLLDREVRLVFISTQTTGPGMAEYLLHTEAGEVPAIATGEYTNLGYLSGGTAALRTFLSDPRNATFSITALGLNPWTDPALESIDKVSDFALVVVISENAEDVRHWVEQGADELTSGFVAVTSAQANPLLQPYLQSQPQTLKGLLSGLQGAAFYEGLRAQDGDGRLFWDAYSFGLGAIVLLILLGGLYGRLIHTRDERPSSRAAPTTAATAETTGSQNAAK
jgi:hypothetical protein